MLPTIIIPAHNAARTIARTLSELHAGIDKYYNIIVVCNGCDDNTSDLVSAFKLVQCHTIEIASKAAAIRYAESFNPSFPRLYLDADIQLTVDNAQLIFSNIQSNSNFGLYLPRSKINTSKSHFTVKSYYKAWYDTPFVKQLGYGSGVYALTKRGRKRFEEWPDFISDDGFIRSHFTLDEIHIIDDACVEVQAPRTWWQLIRIKARSKYGILELKQALKKRRLVQPFITPHIKNKLGINQFALKMNYFTVNIIALIWAHCMKSTQSFTWLKDKSNH